MRLTKPTPDEVRAFVAEQAGLPFTYAAVGATVSTEPPAGYTVDETRVRLGNGEAVFKRAVDALKNWEHFRLGWVEATPADTPVEVGATVCVLARVLGLWWMNACRVVDQGGTDSAARATSWGFSYGTLPGHAESGEERFSVGWDPATGEVSYSIYAFSRPRHPLARLGYPLTRRTQKRFARDSAAAMARCAGMTNAPPVTRGSPERMTRATPPPVPLPEAERGRG